MILLPVVLFLQWLVLSYLGEGKKPQYGLRLYILFCFFLRSHSKIISQELPAALLAQQHLSVLYPVHRLDRPTAGVMVYAKTRPAAAALCAQLQNEKRDTWKKEYLAVICGIPQSCCGELSDYLYRDPNTAKAYVTTHQRRAAKMARLSYQILETVNDTAFSFPLTLVKVHLYTGRFHQIRVQFASRGMPIAGDGKYGSRYKSVHRHCLRINFLFFIRLQKKS